MTMKNEIESLWKGESTALLKELHLLTRDGKINADSRRKLKQVHHLSQLIEPLLKKIESKRGSIHVVDLGAGKSYLGFILYDLVLRHFSNFKITSVESRSELIESSKRLARDSNFTNFHFVSARIEDAEISEKVDLVCTLHACDTATDDAILFGLKHKTEGFALVPCCQAEVARSLDAIPAHSGALSALHDHPIHRREFGSHLTNVIRTLFLRSTGFKVTVTELVGWEHSMKNELILAERVADENHPDSKRAKNELEELLGQFPVKMKLFSSERN